MKEITELTNYKKIKIFLLAFLCFILFLSYLSMQKFLEMIGKDSDEIVESLTSLLNTIEKEIEIKSPGLQEAIEKSNIVLEKMKKNKWI